MAAPTKTDLITLNYAWRGQPFVNVEAKSLSTATLDLAYQGQPFVGADTQVTAAATNSNFFMFMGA